jgi:hypothetical protein
MAIKKMKVKADLKPHRVTEDIWYYRERKYFDIYVHVHTAPCAILNFRIPYSKVLR